MPMKPKKPCRHPGCPKLTDGLYCEEHEALHRGDPVLFWDEKNWQSLCKPCHDKKTWNEDNNPEYRF